ncbi:hypothetical protein [Paraburkholderia kururiensis]|uniref:Uncharacterized protein n=1 Tax=Paraburkholderia kururiensis TaxID=984307 RepID=A0ABZ0WS97_9BURK|nr:hypothetical protein [Paraburkholderia kururiensis]WQD80278.1 hypothetical protein U0042_11670 [Paraburkholderia kururiensis]
MAITNEQLAELLLGIAKSQKAIIDSIALHLGQNGAAFHARALIPTLQGAANVMNHQAQPTLQDLPSRLLLQVQAGGVNRNAQPLDEWLVEQLDRLVP